MKKWILAILAAIVSMIITSTLIVLIFGKPNTIGLFIGAGISFYVGQLVYNHFKTQENSDN